MSVRSQMLVALFSIFLLAMIAAWDKTGRVHGQEGEAKPAAAEGEKKEGEVKEQKNYFMWVIESSGFIGFCLLLMSMYFVALVIQCFMELNVVVACPPDEVATCEQLLGSRDFQGIYDYTRASNSFFSRLTSIGIAELQAGLGEAREVMDRQADADVANLEAKISMLAVMGSVGPMVGLIGTLKGMINSFSVIALSDTQLKASEVAGGISEALILTFEGVALSVPAIFFFAFFRNRVAQMSVETLLASDSVVRRIHQASKQKAPARA